jgi:hypothetical protein
MYASPVTGLQADMGSENLHVNGEDVIWSIWMPVNDFEPLSDSGFCSRGIPFRGRIELASSKAKVDVSSFRSHATT